LKAAIGGDSVALSWPMAGAGMTGPLIDSVPTFRCERGQRAATTVTLLAAATSMDHRSSKNETPKLARGDSAPE
jgi:hypothetical protein